MCRIGTFAEAAVIVDFTRYEVGMALSSRGVIVECPVCGRRAEHRKPDTYVHTVELFPSIVRRTARMKTRDRCLNTQNRKLRRDEIVMAVLLWLLGGDPKEALSKPGDYCPQCDACGKLVLRRVRLEDDRRLCGSCAKAEVREVPF
jgi:hypothetical protein